MLNSSSSFNHGFGVVLDGQLAIYIFDEVKTDIKCKLNCQIALSLGFAIIFGSLRVGQ